jgi:hypothetical protein
MKGDALRGLGVGQLQSHLSGSGLCDPSQEGLPENHCGSPAILSKCD